MTSVKVAVRVRPLNQREKDLESKFIIAMDGKKTTIVNRKVSEMGAEGDHARENMRLKEFTFDHSFWTVLRSDSNYASQEEVFQCLGLDVVASAYDGYNACVFAYGQTGSGKSYSMMGSHDDPGLIPRICQELFSRMTDEDTSYKAEVSYLEIYNEKVRDLLKQSSANKLHSLRVREHPKLGPYVQDLSKHTVDDYEDIKGLMDRGNSIRTTAATNMNDTSSRSHAIFTIVFTQAKFKNDIPCEMSSKIHLVDLAGSERADSSGATGQRLKEGASINKSLVTLGSVISVLAEISEKGGKSGKTFFIPYRDSVLTWLLKDSLGGNSRTIMVATISPADVNYAETLSTLRYANRAKNIINRPTVNEDPNVKLIRDLRDEINRLKTLLGGNIDNISTPKVQEKLHENEARVKVLTEEWAGKWNETQNILQDQTLAIRKEGLGVVLDSTLPHLIGIDDDILSTGIMLYHLKEGSTIVGRPDSEEMPDIEIAGIDVEENHCEIVHKDGEVTLYPLQGAMCSINGSVVADPVKLTQGAVILLGRTNMFRFNHPAEAAKMKQELQSCGLSFSRTSLLGHSMTDLYKSSENLSLLAAGFELEQNNQEDLAKLEDKRLQIGRLEKRHMKADEDRDEAQDSLEKYVQEKQDQLLMMQEQFDEEISIGEKLKILEEKEQFITQQAAAKTQNLDQESEKIRRQHEEQTSQLQALVSRRAELDKLKADTEVEVTAKVKDLMCQKSQVEQKLSADMNELKDMQSKFEIGKSSILDNNNDVKSENLSLEQNKCEFLAQWEKDKEAMTDKWRPPFEMIEVKNQHIEEAWKDLSEHERKHKLREQNLQDMSDEEREKFEHEKHELEMARTLLKEEEERVTREEKELVDDIEKEMDEMELKKKEKLKEIESKKHDVILSSDEELGTMLQRISEKEKVLTSARESVNRIDKELVCCDDKLSEVVDSTTGELEEIGQRQEKLTANMLDEEAVSKTLTDISNKVIEVETDYKKELKTIQSERERLLMNKEATALCEAEENSGERLSEDARLERKMQEIEALRKEMEAGRSDLEEKQRRFEEERNAEMDKIEYEVLKLQEMERQERINALVEQEVKRRMFEEKVERENRRKVERKKEQQDRAEEIQKIKEQHNREVRQLKARLEKISNGKPSKSANSSKSNPYASVMSSDTGQDGTGSPRRHSIEPLGSSLTLSGDLNLLKVTIPTYRLQGYGSDHHYEYEVKVIIGDDSWTIYRRYSRFRQVHQDWKRKIPEINSLVFPPKKLFSRSEKVVAERQKQLELYMQNFLSICQRTPSCSLHSSNNKYLTKQVLCDFETFFKRGLFEVSKHGAT
ncbi:kinesin-like protein KIF16B isoform X2 [Mizuhopecten yessoensis]|uniref:Kinesin-like protein KIF16B n=1 Tax=Mizuhopecten yessoensis TaxID=6573 RepID=A0A210QWK5_MIZYE|nr:kinesin-like protein KIF16B isoform X2 [Mizuhopecten yessoensis]OWF53130.1 Kinesin-like protein KIF16B [Mizuhopecten yessoensis]